MTASSSPVQIEKFTPEEKVLLLAVLKKKLLLKSILYVSVILILAVVLIYILSFPSGIENSALLYLAMGITAAICAKMLFAEWSDYKREIRSEVKRVVNTRILYRDSKTLAIGNQHFKRQQIILDASDFDRLNSGDAIRVEYSAQSHTIFSIKKIWVHDKLH